MPAVPTRVHHHLDVFHHSSTVGTRRHRPIGETGPARVEHDQTAEGRKTIEEAGHRRRLPLHVEVRHPLEKEHEIERSVSHHLGGDMDPVRSHRIASLRSVDHVESTLQPSPPEWLTQRARERNTPNRRAWEASGFSRCADVRLPAGTSRRTRCANRGDREHSTYQRTQFRRDTLSGLNNGAAVYCHPHAAVTGRAAGVLPRV
jgi:hypothetical protein